MNDQIPNLKVQGRIKVQEWRQTATVAALLLFMLVSCDELDRPLHFEVPPAYTGPILLIEAPDNPKVVLKTSSEYRIVVPPTGFVRLSDAWVLHSWHKTDASYSGGKAINTIPANPGITFYEVSTETRDNRVCYNWFFVGDAAEEKKFFYSEDSTELQKQWLKQHGVE